jgi:hypothetical protein
MSNDVLIRVRVKEDARDGFAAVGQHAEAEGERSAQKFSSRFGAIMGKLGNLVQEQTKKAGQKIGDDLGQHSGQNMITRLKTVLISNSSKLAEVGKTVGERIGESVTREVAHSVDEGVRRGADGRLRDTRSGRYVSERDRRGKGGDGGDAHVDVDVDKQSLLSRFADWGREASSSFFDKFSDGISNFFSGDILSTVIKGAGILALGPLIAAPVSAAVSAGILAALGTGVIAVGVAAALKDPRIQGAVGEMKTRLGKLFERFGDPFKGPVANFLEKFNAFITSMVPNFDHLGRVLGPVADKLGSGIIGMLQNMLPGIIDALEGSAPVVETLAKRLPDIGQALGDFFREISENGEDAATFFNDLITVILKVIHYVGVMIGFFTRLYGGIREFASDAKTIILDFAGIVIDWFGRILDAGVTAFGWIPGLGGKLATAKAQFADARKGINAELAKIKDRDVKIRIRIFGQAAANAALGTAQALADLGYGKAAGGIQGSITSIGRAASGGVRSGLTWVGEHGPELANLQPGQRVWSNGDSMRMAGSGGEFDGAVVQAEIVGTSDPLLNEIFKAFQFKIGRRFQGSAEFGWGRA